MRWVYCLMAMLRAHFNVTDLKPSVRKVTLASLLPKPAPAAASTVPSGTTGTVAGPSGNARRTVDDDDEGDGVSEPLWKRLKAKKTGGGGPSLV